MAGWSAQCALPLLETPFTLPALLIGLVPLLSLGCSIRETLGKAGRRGCQGIDGSELSCLSQDRKSLLPPGPLPCSLAL